MGHSTSGLPVHHQLPESTQTHVHWVGDAIQPSHLLSSPSPPALNLSQHQDLFKRVSSSHQVAKVLGLQHQLQHLCLVEFPLWSSLVLDFCLVRVFFDYWLNCKLILIISLFRLSIPFWFSLGRLYVHYYSVVQLVGI